MADSHIDRAGWREILRTATAEAGAVDLSVYRAVAQTPTPVLDRGVPRLSHMADRSMLWLAIAAAMFALGGRSGRRAARDGLIAIGMASASVNQGFKRVAVRARPERDDEALAKERWVRMPLSTSFPSGHTASAFAFATAAGEHLPLLWLPLRGLALVVGYSRVHTGVHYPGDVIAGAVIGSACGWTVIGATRRRDRARAAAAASIRRS
jgi:membrane-associated phospholipid phosphatase